MSKNRFSTIDVRAMVRDIRCNLLGKKVANIYDLSEKCYLLKFAIPGQGMKSFLLLESGIRFHSTRFLRELPELPSPFTMKLRKYIRLKRLEDINQVGMDRVVIFTFGHGTIANHIILELYSNGNIILTDHNYEVIALLRTHQFSEDVKLRVGEIYPISLTTNMIHTHTGRVVGDVVTDNHINSNNNSSNDSVIRAVDNVSVDINVDTSVAVAVVTDQGDDGDDVTGIRDANVERFLSWAMTKLTEHTCYHASHSNTVGIDHLTDHITSSTTAATATTSSLPSVVLATATTSTSSVSASSSNNRLLSLPDKKGKKKIKEFMMRQLLLSKECVTSSYGPEVVDHCLLSSGITPDHKVKAIGSIDMTRVMSLLVSLRDADMVVEQLDVPGSNAYIIVKGGNNNNNNNNNNKEVEEYVEFLPALYAQHKDKVCLTYSSFDEAVDEYYCKVEEQKLNKEANQAELAATKKLDKVKKDQEQMRKGLEVLQTKMQRQAMLLECYAEDVDKVCLVINSALGAGMGWEEIEDMVSYERANGNAIASLISKLKLSTNHVVLKLVDYSNDDDDESDDHDDKESDGSNHGDDSDESGDSPECIDRKNHKKKKQHPHHHHHHPHHQHAQKKVDSSQVVEVEIDLALSAYANARDRYREKKVASVKEQKTIEVTKKVLSSVESQIMKSLDGLKLKRSLRSVRKSHWFEKFNWCFSSEGYLMVSGRDLQQMSLIVSKYLRQGDIYVHADNIGDASMCVIRAKDNKRGGGVTSSSTMAMSMDMSMSMAPISPIAIQEAGMMVICRSSAWKSKNNGAAPWWVWGKQVIRQAVVSVGDAKKTSSSSQTSSSSSISIIGSKHCLPPMPLEMGFGILFRLDDDTSRSRHVRDWKDRDYSNDMETMSMLTDNLDRYDLSLEDLNLNSLDLNENDDEDEDDDDKVDDKVDGNDNNASVFEDSSKANECVEGGEDKVEQTVVDNEAEEVAVVVVTEDGDEEGDDEEGDDSDGDGIEDTERDVGNGKDIDDESDVQYDDNNNHDDEESRNNDNTEMKSLEKSQKNRVTEKSNSSNKKDSGAKKVKELQGRGRGDIAKKNNDDSDNDNVVGGGGGSGGGSGSNKRGTKYVNKKKARRYANQDEDDRELAMLGLGHTSHKTGQKLVDMQKEMMREKERKELKQKQHKVGVKLVEKEAWSELKLLLDISIASRLDELILTNTLKASDLSSQEIRALSKFPVHQGIDIVRLFCEAQDLSRVGNKSAFLAGIIRRYSMDARKGGKNQSVGKRNQDKSLSSSSSSSSSVVVATASSTVVEMTEDTVDNVMSIIHDDESSIHDNNDNNDNDDGQESSNLTDEVEQFTGSPVAEDILMYALPVCCPYACLKNYKYKVKLTPGVGKKGKSCKQAIEVFSRFKDCSVREKEVITGLTDTEMVATMIGDVKLSMPGLYLNQGQQKQQQQQGKMKKGKVMK